MTQDLKDLCLIDKSALLHMQKIVQANKAYTASNKWVLPFVKKAIAQDLSGMRLVPPVPAHHDYFYLTPWCSFAQDLFYFATASKLQKPELHNLASYVFANLPAAPGLETEEPKA